MQYIAVSRHPQKTEKLWPPFPLWFIGAKVGNKNLSACLHINNSTSSSEDSLWVSGTCPICSQARCGWQAEPWIKNLTGLGHYIYSLETRTMKNQNASKPKYRRLVLVYKTQISERRLIFQHSSNATQLFGRNSLEISRNIAVWHLYNPRSKSNRHR